MNNSKKVQLKFQVYQDGCHVKNSYFTVYTGFEMYNDLSSKIMQRFDDLEYINFPGRTLSLKSNNYVIS